MLVTLLFLAVAAFIIWLIVKEYNKEPTESSFKALTINPNTLNVSRGRYTAPVAIAAEPKTTHSVPELKISRNLRKMEWFQFEKLVELIYQHRGYSVKRLGDAKPDGGVDLIIESAEDKFVVQCKHWKKWTVGVKQIREFLGTLTDSRIPKGVFITLAGYSDEAKQLAEKQGIQILNQTDVLEMLEQAGLTHSEQISELFSDTRKFCPKCESEMVLRTNHQTGNKFWGCSNFPTCWGKLDYEA